MFRSRAEENFLKRVLVEISNVSRPVIILTRAGNSEVAIDGKIVIRLAGERPAVKALASEAR
jgi:hypothetical protein